MYTHTDFHLTCDMLLHYLVKVKNSKMLPGTDFDSIQQTVDMFLRTL